MPMQSGVNITDLHNHRLGHDGQLSHTDLIQVNLKMYSLYLYKYLRIFEAKVEIRTKKLLLFKFLPAFIKVTKN